MKLFAGIAALALLTACRMEPAVDSNKHEAAIPAEAPIKGASAESPLAPETVPDPAPEETPEPAPDLPIDVGTYVEAGVDCGNPPNASWRIWNGEGLSGSTTRACKASPVVQQADGIKVEQTCIDNHSGTPSNSTFVLRPTGRTRFALIGDGGDQSFRLCPGSELPQWLREAKR